MLRSRGSIFLLTLLLLLALDAARSWNARVGYEEPTTRWKPVPEQYAQLTWPPGASAEKGLPLGAQVYAQRCSVCHGPEGGGNGPAAPSLIPRPRDLTSDSFQYKSTAAGQPPSDDDLIRIVSKGLHASSMPYFEDILSPEEIRAVVEHVKGFSDAFAQQPAVSEVPPRLEATAESLGRGKELYGQLCVSCHGEDGRLFKTFADAKEHTVRSRDLTAPWTFRGGDSPEQLWLRLSTGVGVMPSYAEAVTPEDRWHVVNYVLSLRRAAPWEPGGKLEGPGHAQDRLARGEYLVRAEMCGLCHTQIDSVGIYRTDEAYLAGGMRISLYPYGTFVSRNLTSDEETGIGRWTEEQIATALRTGRAPDRVLHPYAMMWIVLNKFSEEDALAIASYLKSLPPVKNEIPPPLHNGFLETVLAKMTRKMPAALPVAITYGEGNMGNEGGKAAARQRVLVTTQWVVLLGGLLAWLLAAPRGKRLPTSVKGWALVGLALFGFFILSIFHKYPANPQVPVERLVDGITAQIPPVDVAKAATPEQRQLAERGRYLYTVQSCVMCHGQDGSGGVKLSWRPYGSRWVRNISSDVETGIGGWTDAQISRAIRSGLSRDGQPLHWQAMIWDLASNLDEEDIRSLVTYLRMMPPVKRQVQAPFPPSENDCETYTFYMAVDQKPGSGCYTTE